MVVTTPLLGAICRPRLELAMINMHTKFEVSSLSRSRDILGGIKIKNGSRDVITPFRGRFVIYNLGLAMFNPHTKFEASAITATKKLKATPNVKILVLSHPLGNLEVMHC